MEIVCNYNYLALEINPDLAAGRDVDLEDVRLLQLPMKEDDLNHIVEIPILDEDYLTALKILTEEVGSIVDGDTAYTLYPNR